MKFFLPNDYLRQKLDKNFRDVNFFKCASDLSSKLNLANAHYPEIANKLRHLKKNSPYVINFT